jgi:hypothetical protein
VAIVPVVQQEGGLGESDLGGDLLHPRGVHPPRVEDDPGRVTALAVHVEGGVTQNRRSFALLLCGVVHARESAP